MDKPDMGNHQTEYGLSNQMVFDRGQLWPGGKINFKNAYQYQNRIQWPNMDEPDMSNHETEYGL